LTIAKAQNRKSVLGYVMLAWLSGRCCHEGFVSMWMIMTTTKSEDQSTL